MNFAAGIPRGFLSPVIKICKLILSVLGCRAELIVEWNEYADEI